MDEGFKKPNKEDMNVKNIQTERQFWLWLEDALVQFSAIKLIASSLGDNELVSYIGGKMHFRYQEWLAREGKKLSDKILSNEKAMKLLTDYNNLIQRLDTFKNREELDQIIQESGEVFHKFDLGIDK